MASPHLADDDNDDSDYGPDFTPEEQELADRLLAAASLDDSQDIEDIGQFHYNTRQHASKARLSNSFRSHKRRDSPVLSCEDDSMDLVSATKTTEPDIASEQESRFFIFQPNHSN